MSFFTDVTGKKSFQKSDDEDEDEFGIAQFMNCQVYIWITKF
jgi:hypothetical protein